MRPVALALFLLLQVSPVRAEQLWLVISASDTSPGGIAAKAKQLGKGTGIIVQTRDCGAAKDFFAWVVDIAPSLESSRVMLDHIKTIVPDSYVKKCQVQPESLLSFRHPAVNMSIAEVPSSAVNWEDKDRVSEVRKLKHGTHVIISRYYERNEEDPLEGRRERVILVGRQHQPVELEKACISPEKFVVADNLVAFQCVREQAADELLHAVVVFSDRGNKIREIRNCRNPHLSPSKLACDSESVGPTGVLRLKREVHHL